MFTHLESCKIEGNKLLAIVSRGTYAECVLAIGILSSGVLVESMSQAGACLVLKSKKAKFSLINVELRLIASVSLGDLVEVEAEVQSSDCLMWTVRVVAQAGGRVVARGRLKFWECD